MMVIPGSALGDAEHLWCELLPWGILEAHLLSLMSWCVSPSCWGGSSVLSAALASPATGPRPVVWS